MKLLLTIKETDVTPDAQPIDASSFQKRDAARAILIDKDGAVYLLHVSKHGYHKLPGGGVDDGEDIKTALARELMEEVGCTAEVVAEVGKVVEYRDRFKLLQTSYCFIARQVGNQVESALEEGEIAEGFKEVKVHNIHAAIKRLKSDEPDNYEGRFIKIRDIALLQAAKELLK